MTAFLRTCKNTLYTEHKGKRNLHNRQYLKWMITSNPWAQLELKPCSQMDGGRANLRITSSVVVFTHSWEFPPITEAFFRITQGSCVVHNLPPTGRAWIPVRAKSPTGSQDHIQLKAALPSSTSAHCSISNAQAAVVAYVWKWCIVLYSVVFLGIKKLFFFSGRLFLQGNYSMATLC